MNLNQTTSNIATNEQETSSLLVKSTAMNYFCNNRTRILNSSMPRIDFHYGKEFSSADIYLWHIEEDCDILSRLIGDNGMHLAESIRRFKSEKRRREWLATRALLQQTPYKDTEIRYHDNGQPHTGDSGKQISISHTRGYAAIALSETPIGIDIETEERNALAVADAFMQPREKELLMACAAPASEALRLWTVKEAAFKLAPQHSQVLKDIHATAEGNGFYSIIYKDGTTATCHTTEHCGIIVSCAQYNSHTN
jgi:phosphopantetheinyl transferase